MQLTKGVFRNVLDACAEGNTPQHQVPSAAEDTKHPQQQHKVQQAIKAAPQSTTGNQHRLQKVHRNKWKRFLPLYSHCGKPVHWQRGWALCDKAGDKQRRRKVYQQEIHCCHCRRRFDFTLNSRQTDNTWCPFQRACPLCKTAFHSAACMPAPKSTVSVH